MRGPTTIRPDIGVLGQGWNQWLPLNPSKSHMAKSNHSPAADIHDVPLDDDQFHEALAI